MSTQGRTSATDAATRRAGRITGWDDGKGYGFVTPHDGGARAFVHIKAFQQATRRPFDGDLISYATRVDGKGRLNAVDVRFAGQRVAAPRAAPRSPTRHRAPMRIPRAGIAVAFLAVAVALMLLGIAPALVTLVYLVMSAVSYIAYVLDKDAAGKRRRQRTPEATLHALDTLGGWPGGLIAQQQMRHKTVKASFQAGFAVSVVVNLLVVAALWYGGVAGRMSDFVLGR
ncbi:cold shock and DUF1294 domain-containing protein [Lysobacter sp. A3-1-A15]|uniref:cold shock and DUF1294 domain-containing protein n=1 Tax=Novilysobacter viscosus TaxID=3098602 RepID=UPI002EDB1DCC